MIIGTSAFLWLLALLLAARLAGILRRSAGGAAALRIIWLAAVLAAAILLLRPHEDIFGGEDPGAYVNSGITHGRLLAFFYVDPLLSQVPTETRPLFFYGHSGYGTTKDACLWVRDTGQALIGPHFQPAYPLLVSMASRLFGPFAGLYVVPIFALLAGLALAALATQCIHHRWSGIAAFALWTLNPLVLWHGRCARPEIIAAFMFFGGSALLLVAWNNSGHRLKMRFDIMLGTLCMGFAPFFHVTAWILVIPAACVITITGLTARREFLLAPIAWLVPAAALLYQVRKVTDYYGIYHFLSFPLRHPIISAGLLIAGAALAALIWLAAGGRTERDARPLSLSLGAALAAATILFFAVSYFTRDAEGSLPILGCPLHHYLYMTDLKALGNMLSRPMLLLAAAGWAAWLTGRDRFRRTRALAALTVFPALMFAGNINDFMMTRYFIVAVIPVSALSITALVTLPPDRRSWATLPAILALAIGLAGLNGRRHLVTIVEHRGLARFLQPFAQTITGDGGILLCEYSRFAAPFEHFFGIPTLGLDSERNDDYSRQETAWAEIMRSNPNKPAFFITPYQQPLSAHFNFSLERSSVFSDKSLQQAYNNLPTRILEGPIPLTLYRMSLKDGSGQERELTEPRVVTMDAGNMGLSGFSTVRVRTRTVRGVPLAAGESIHLDIPLLHGDSGELLLFLMTDAPYPRMPLIKGIEEHGQSESRSEFLRLADNWRLLRFKQIPLNQPVRLEIEAAEPAFLVEAMVISGGDTISLAASFPAERMVKKEMMPFKARWARAEAEAIIPAPSNGKGIVMILLEAPNIKDGAPAEFGISGANAFQPLKRLVDTSRWQWQVWSVNAHAAFKGDSIHLHLSTNPAWDSGLRGFPSDLGVLVGYIVVMEQE